MTQPSRDLADILAPPRSPDGCPTDWTLQRFVTQELPGRHHDHVSEHVVACAHCRDRVAQLDDEREAFLAAHPFSSVQQEVAERALFLDDEPEIAVPASSAPGWQLALLTLVGAAAAVLVMGLVVPLGDGRPGGAADEAPPYTGVKGATDLRAAVLRDGSLLSAAGDVVLAPGDELQFQVDTGPYDHVAIVGVDGTGAVSVYQPVGGGSSLPVAPGGGRVLETAFRLDDAPGPEVFVAVFTDGPVEAEAVAGEVQGWVDRHGVAGMVQRAPDTALGGAVEVLAFDKRVSP